MDMKINLDGLEKERDFYFTKLRDIEIMCQDVEGAESLPLVQKILDVLYQTEVMSMSLTRRLISLTLYFASRSLVRFTGWFCTARWGSTRGGGILKSPSERLLRSFEKRTAEENVIGDELHISTSLWVHTFAHSLAYAGSPYHLPPTRRKTLPSFFNTWFETEQQNKIITWCKIILKHIKHASRAHPHGKVFS